MKAGSSTARFQATLVTFFAMFIHIVVVLAGLKRIFPIQFDDTRVKIWFNENKLLFLLIMALLMMIVYFYYNKKRIEEVLNKYSINKKYNQGINNIKVILILLLPIVLGAVILLV